MSEQVKHIATKLSDIGGKAFNLNKLKSVGMNVPAFAILGQKHLLDIISKAAKNDILAEKELIKSADIAQSVYQLVDTGIESPKNKLFAVRSSGLQEDGQAFSFAGQFDTYLYVNYEDIPAFVKKVWLSNYSERVVSYTQNNNLNPQKGIAVIIQEMIDPEVSGVGFGINPSTGEQGSKVLSAVYGVGEGLVSGELDADTFVISKGEVTSKLVKKEKAGKAKASGSISYQSVDANLQLKASLSSNNIKELISILDRLEQEIGGPQDIEFAIKDDIIYLLQTRPITAIFKQATFKSEGKNRIIWDNSNIIESYPGVTTPLTFSYILNAYRQVYAQLALIFGVSKKKVEKNKSTFNSMLGLINGRVYYNLFSWYRMLALFPGYKLNARFMENMMGVKERFDLPKEDNSSKLTAIFRTIWMAFRIIGHMFTIKSQTKRYLRDVENSIRDYKKLDLEKMTAFELKEEWIEIEAYLTSRWRAPILTDSFALYYFGKLQAKVKKYKLSENENLHNDLLCGSQDIISVEPIHRTIELAADATKNNELKILFENKSGAEVWNILHEGKYPDFLKKIEAYIDDFGDRCVGELKLETISYKQEPELYIETIKSFVVQGIISKNTSSNVDIELREKAEKVVNEALKYRPIRKWKFYKLLKKTRFLVSNRENLRYERTRVFGLTREMFSQIGREFEKAGVLESYRDVFYLTMQELFGFIDGSSVDTDLKALTSLRKAEYQKYEEMEWPAERFTTFDAVNFGNNFFDTSIEEDFTGDLKGIGCCPGKVKGRVRVVKHPREVASMDGDILVTSSTDPGWVTLFPSSSAIIVERGSLLSHSAIVSREMGIPCIVSVTSLLKTLKTGDLIEMDGSAGTIKILEVSKAHLENIAFDFIRYANCWEDVELLISAFDLNENSKILSIASGGDNCFSLLAQNPKQVIAVDISPVQLYLVELKKIAIAHFSRADFLQFTGFTKSTKRIENYQKIRLDLSDDAKKYWDNHETEILEGIIHVGKFERYFQLFKKEYLHTIHDQKTIDQLFEIKPAEDQLSFYNSTWFDNSWKQMHSTFFGKKMLGESGRDPEFMKQIDGSVPNLILEREVAHLKSTLCQTNPFLFYILNNHFDEEHLPHYVRKENYEAVKANLHKLVLAEGLVEEIASKHSEISHFNLSNIFEYMNVEQFKLASKNLLGQATPNAMFAYWNFMVHRNIADLYPTEISDLKEKSELLSQSDFGYFYKSFVLNQKQ